MVKDFFADLFLSANEVLNRFGTYKLMIHSGCHAGTRKYIQPSTISIGSASDGSIILLGDSVKSRHVDLELPQGILEDVIIKPVEGSVAIEEVGSVEIGQSAVVKSGVKFLLDEVKLSVHKIPEARGLWLMGYQSLILIAAISLIVLLTKIVLSSNIVDEFQFKGDNITEANNLTSAVDVNNQKAERTRLEKQFGLEFEKYSIDLVAHQLYVLDLHESINLRETENGALKLTGVVEKSNTNKWIEFLYWYDTKQKFPVIILDINLTEDNENFPKIKSVWLNSLPTVFLDDGTVLQIGNVSKKGWKLIALDTDQVIFEKEGKRFSFNY